MIIMTEKDAIKCQAFADDRFYCARGHAQVDEQLITLLLAALHIK